MTFRETVCVLLAVGCTLFPLTLSLGCITPPSFEPPISTPKLLLDLITKETPTSDTPISQSDYFRYYIMGVTRVRYDTVGVNITSDNGTTYLNDTLTYAVSGEIHEKTFVLNATAVHKDISYRVDISVMPSLDYKKFIIRVRMEDNTREERLSPVSFPFEEVFKIVSEEE